jgi:peptidoglycan hydrolase-like protein with peptidoglycan-binding domain
MSTLMKSGSSGEAVKALQRKLASLGFDVPLDGEFGAATESAVRELQTLFGYTVDGMVGSGTAQLIDAQLSYRWDRRSADAEVRAITSQRKDATERLFRSTKTTVSMKRATKR